MTDTLTLLDRLIAFPTVSADSNLDLISFAATHLSDLGFAVERIPAPDGRKAGLVARLGPEGPGGALLSAHSDVVPVAGQDWTVDPFRLTRQGARVHGRGTTDMKGFLAAMLSVASRAAGRRLAEPLRLVISYDEEVGCTGIRAMLDRLAPHLGQPSLCIVGEPTGMRPAIGHKGKTAYRATCIGEAGHSSLAPRFVNALHLAAELIAGLRALQAELEADGLHDPAHEIPVSTVHAGRLRGGTALNIVPDRAVLDFEIRNIPADDPAPLQARVEALARRIAAGHPAPAEVRIEVINAYPGLEIAADHPAVARMQALSGQAPVKVPYGTEAGFFAALGIPTLVCGPGDMQGQGHKPDEYVTLEQLSACDALLDRLLDQLEG